MYEQVRLGVNFFYLDSINLDKEVFKKLNSLKQEFYGVKNTDEIQPINYWI